MTDERVEVDVERTARVLHMSAEEVEALLKRMAEADPPEVRRRLEHMARMANCGVEDVKRFLEGREHGKE